MYFEQRQTPPDNSPEGKRYMMALIDALDHHLTRNGVPTERFDEMYDAAVDLYVRDGLKGPFNIFTYLQGWNVIKGRQVPKEPEPCKQEHDDEDEKTVEIFFFRLGVWRLMPCPNCREKAFDQKLAELLKEIGRSRDDLTSGRFCLETASSGPDHVTGGTATGATGTQGSATSGDGNVGQPDEERSTR